MGVVYEAQHLYTGRPVALKLLRPEVSEDPRRGERLIREAQAAAALDHDGIVDVLDMGEADGCLYLALERLWGRDLAAELELRGSLPPGEAVAVSLAVLSALGAAHCAGIVHRDVKPGNIFLARRGERVVPKLLDFGIAKVRDVTLTTTGAILGTPHYMSPEAAGGELEPSPAMDVWSAAVVLYECLAGAPPFGGPTPTAVLMNVLRGELEPLHVGGAAAVSEVVTRALRRPRTAGEEDRRFADAKSFADALERAAREDGLALSLTVDDADGLIGGEARPPSTPLPRVAPHVPTRTATSGGFVVDRGALEVAATVDTGSGALSPLRPAPASRRSWWLGLAVVSTVGAAWLLWPRSPTETPAPPTRVSSTPSALERAASPEAPSTPSPSPEVPSPGSPSPALSSPEASPPTLAPERSASAPLAMSASGASGAREGGDAPSDDGASQTPVASERAATRRPPRAAREGAATLPPEPQREDARDRGEASAPARAAATAPARVGEAEGEPSIRTRW